MADNNRFEYFKIRLEHTLQHTQQSTRLIYLVNGGILAVFYFLTGHDINWIDKTTVGVFLLEVLAVINIVHAKIIRVQGMWYHLIDAGLADSAMVTPPRSGFRVGTHALYRRIHLFLAGSIIMAAA